MIGNYALMLIATDRLHVLEHILFLLTHTTCTIRTFSIDILSCPFQWPVQLCELFCFSSLVVLILKLRQPQQSYTIQSQTSYFFQREKCHKVVVLWSGEQRAFKDHHKPLYTSMLRKAPDVLSHFR